MIIFIISVRIVSGLNLATRDHIFENGLDSSRGFEIISVIMKMGKRFCMGLFDGVVSDIKSVKVSVYGNEVSPFGGNGGKSDSGGGCGCLIAVIVIGFIIAKLFF